MAIIVNTNTVSRLSWRRAIASGMALALFLGMFFIGRVLAAGPIETNIFSVQGVEVDVTDSDAATAKTKAIVEVQAKAFHRLIDELGNARMVEKTVATEPQEIAEYLKSLSIEEELVSPGRYAGRFTVRFLPDKMAKLFGAYGVKVQSQQAAATLVIPVWLDNGNLQVWQDNLWRKAWLELNATKASVPIIVALGDQEDERLVSAQDIETNNQVKLEAIRRRYDVSNLLIARAEPVSTSAIKVRIEGQSPIGMVRILKDYESDDGTIDGAARFAARRFADVMESKFKSDAQALAASKGNAAANAITVAVPFTSPSQWNGIRSRILSTPGIKRIDVSSLDGDGAVIRLFFVGDLADITLSFQSTGLGFSQSGATWMIEGL
jgi:hypothetical protein